MAEAEMDGSESTPPNIHGEPFVVGLVSLGCAKNLVDSEKMLASLALDGYVVTGDLDAADVAIINTCAFLEAAREESARTIDELVARKRRGALELVVVAGCWPQFDRDAILNRWPDVDALVGLEARDHVGRLLKRLSEKPQDQPAEDIPPLRRAASDDHERLRLTPRHLAYLRISEGCNNRCSYCTIPLIRGRLRSKPLSCVLTEAAELIRDGAKELVLIGQDTTAYGRDIKGSLDVAGLLARLDQLPGVRWLRLLYTHPASFNRSLLEAYGRLDHLLPYVDLPLQHISDRILESMGRRVTRKDIEGLVENLRQERPDVVLRTTFIVGYPGETDEEFGQLLDFVREVRFDRLGAFPFSPEAHTRAAELPNRVPPEIREARLRELMATQRKISEQNHRALIGEALEVIIDQGTSNPDKPAVGRVWGQAPDIDGVTRVVSDRPLCAGETVLARISDAGPYDLEAHALPR